MITIDLKFMLEKLFPGQYEEEEGKFFLKGLLLEEDHAVYYVNGAEVGDIFQMSTFLKDLKEGD